IVRETPISGVHTFYTDANKQGKAGYKSEDLSKVVQSPYNSVQKSELYAILLVLMDFSEPLNIVTDSQYAERVVLHIETAEFIPDESELTSLFIQLQDIIRNRKHPLYITHIRSHMGLPGHLAQDNDEIDKLLIGNVLEASEFHKKHHVNSKGLKRDFSITWQQAKEIVRKCPTCSFYNQTPLPAGCNPKGTQRNDIWQMDVFHFAEFGKLKYVHHTIDTYSGFQWATALSSEKAHSVIMHLLEVMAIMGIPAQVKTDNAPAYDSGKMKQFFAYYNIKHITDLCYTSTVTPKLIINLVATKKSISYNGCMTQLFTMHFFGGIEVFILTGMAYDRYVAICKPLHYTIIMSRQKCDAMITASCAGGFLHSFGQFLLAVFLPYCGPNEIDHYFCDVYPLLKLACTDTRKIGFLVIANSGLMGFVTFVVLLISYAVIIYTVRSYSAENRRKALSTCSSHITVVVLFFVPLLFIYIRPATTLPEDKVFALFYTIIAPMLNPLIYTLRNKEMKNAIMRLCYRITGNEQKSLKGMTAFYHHTVS
ncbi:hypothetical protein STEG23_037091, partial [Scotinomys teguina]